ncbi:hypothetical protein KJ836_03775 [Patescibacteria group bacterium]|nr:hypothetical protein [Patescibacteria group bacterium]
MKTKLSHKSFAKSVGLWVKLTILILVVADVINLIYTKQSFAQTTVIPDFAGQINDIFSEWMPMLVGALAVVVIIVAGIVYAFDLGGGKQAGIAKEMIISAISGVILFILARWLLGELSSVFSAPDQLQNLGDAVSMSTPFNIPPIPGN